MPMRLQRNTADENELYSETIPKLSASSAPSLEWSRFLTLSAHASRVIDD